MEHSWVYREKHSFESSRRKWRTQVSMLRYTLPVMFADWTSGNIEEV